MNLSIDRTRDFRIKVAMEPPSIIILSYIIPILFTGNGVVDVQEFLIFMASRTLYKDEDQNIR